jgi:hypothetical protein
VRQIDRRDAVPERTAVGPRAHTRQRVEQGHREKLTICWAVLGEKQVLSPGFGTGPYHPALRMSGAYVLSEGRAMGFVKQMLDDPNSEEE